MDYTSEYDNQDELELLTEYLGDYFEQESISVHSTTEAKALLMAKEASTPEPVEKPLVSRDSGFSKKIPTIKSRSDFIARLLKRKSRDSRFLRRRKRD